MKKKIGKMFLGVLVALSLLWSGGGTSLQTVKAANVTLSSTTIANYFNSQVGKTVPQASCLAFIADGFQALGATRSSANCAYEYGSSHIVSTSKDNIPVGADVFFLWNSNYTGTWYTCGNHYCHHIGVYVGDGYVVHTSGGKVVKTELSRLLSGWNMDFRGWGYHGNVTISDAADTDGSRLINTNVSNVTQTTARIATKVSPAGSITECGFYLGTSPDNMSKTVENAQTAGCTDIWYDLGTGKWTGALNPGTTYYYQIYAVIGGVTYKSSLCSFTTAHVELNSITMSRASAQLAEKGTLSLYVTYNPGNTTVDRTVAWYTSNASVATVDNNGTVTAKGAGTATITAMVGDKAATCTITVTHVPVIDKKVAPTCTTTGKTEGSHCSVCGKVIKAQTSIGTTGHTYDNGKVTKKATCTKTGTKTYTCTKCGKTKTANIAKAKHSYKKSVTKATTSKNGKVTEKCSVCGSTKKTTIYRAAAIVLAEEQYTYSGSVLKPSITVKDSKGKKISKDNYSVSYADNRNVGQATVTVSLKGNYTGKMKTTFLIAPKGTSISGLQAKTSGFTVKWKKQTSQTTGYQIQYSTSKNFTENTSKTVLVTSNTSTGKTIKNLSSFKKYYVRVRTFRTVKVDGKTRKIYSDWSKTKTITTK